MTAKISTPVGEATVEGRVWTSDNKWLENLLKDLMPHYVGGEDPNPDLTAAMYAIEHLPKMKAFPVKIISYTESAPLDKDLVY